MSDLRPVTPVAILAAGLAELVDDEGVPAGVRERLAPLAALAGGLDPFVRAHTTPPSADLIALEEATLAHPWGERLEAEMLSGDVEGALLQMLIRVGGARDVVEVGMFTGYATLAMAEALPEGGTVTTLEVDEEAAAVGREAFARSAVGDRITVEIGPAEATLRRLRDEGAGFDLAFVDADKAGYGTYLDLLLGGGSTPGLLRPGGVVCVDNTLMQGLPWTDPGATANAAAITRFDERVRADPALETVLVPLRDGVSIIRRRDDP